MPQGERREFFIALFAGIFVGGFLALFKPFGLSEENNWNLIKVIGFGVVTFFCLLFLYFVLPKLFPKFYSESKYTIGKDLFSSCLAILVIGIANTLYAGIWHEFTFSNHLAMVWNTFLVGIFPITFITMLQYNKLIREHGQDSKEINAAKEKQTLAQNLTSSAPPTEVQIQTENDKIILPVDQLYFIESVGNYANVVQKTNEKISRNLYRTTLKSIQEANKLKGLIRCHRSYIINLDQVKEVNGNAQGLRLTLKGCDEIVPVSRKYVPAVKSYFA